MYYIIVSCTQDGGISKDGKIPWKIKEDMDFFKKTTVGDGNNAVIMGRKTFFSIPEKYRPLKNRLNIVLTNNVSKYEHLQTDSLIFVNSYKDIFEHTRDVDKIFNIGGKALYEMGFYDLKLSGIYLTKVLDYYETDEETKCYFFNMENLRNGYYIKGMISTEMFTSDINYERFLITPHKY